MPRIAVPIAFVLIVGVGTVLGSKGGAVSGTVEILETGGAKRTVVREVLVYLAGSAAAAPAASQPQRSRELSSQDKTFVPHVQVVLVGEEVSFPNADDIRHNVFSITRGNRFDLGLYTSGARKTHVFETPGLVRVYCNIHSQMSRLRACPRQPVLRMGRARWTLSYR